MMRVDVDLADRELGKLRGCATVTGQLHANWRPAGLVRQTPAH